MPASQFADLPILDDIRVASPCTANWEEMTGNDRQRFCSQCRKHVFNLSAMTRSEAQQIVGAADSLCVRFYRRDDGTVMTQDCPVGLALIRRKAWRATSLVAAMAFSLFTTALARPFWKPNEAVCVESKTAPVQVAPAIIDYELGDMGPPPSALRPTTGKLFMGGSSGPPR